MLAEAQQPMWLVLDIGNSAAKGGFFGDGPLKVTFRLELNRTASQEAWAAALMPHLDNQEVTRVGIASVVPETTERLGSLFEDDGMPVDVIHYQMRLPFDLAYETPHTLGTDRLAAAAAAWIRYGLADPTAPRAVVALDAGTAVTYEVVDRTGTFRGGMIGAGPRVVRDALHQGTAQLPSVPLVLPPTPIGRSTQEAMQAGILFSFLDGVCGMLRRIADVLGEPPIVVATGGWSAFLAEHVPIDHLDPHLVLHGIGELMRLNGSA